MLYLWTIFNCYELVKINKTVLGTAINIFIRLIWRINHVNLKMIEIFSFKCPNVFS